jgi:hypothetical protein
MDKMGGGVGRGLVRKRKKGKKGLKKVVNFV